MDAKVEAALTVVRAAVSSVSDGLDPDEYRAFLEEMLADAEGWKMELEDDEEEE